MSTFKIVTPILGQSGISDTGTSQLFPLGRMVDAVDIGTGTAAGIGAGRFVYARGSNVASVGQFVHLINGSAVLLASANSSNANQVGMAAGVLSATNVFGWVQVQGVADYGRGTNSSIAAGAPLYLCGTSGLLAAASAAGSRVDGVHCPVSYTSAQSASLTVYLDGGAFIRGLTALQ